MHKIGEIWTTDDGSGCFVLVVLVIIAGVIALPIMGIIWAWNAGSNFAHYRTIDTETAHARATATVVAIKAEATAIALVPVETDPRYYTRLTERANISIGSISDLGYDENLDSIYFNIDFTNGDDRPHTIDVVFQGRLAKKYEGSLVHAPGPFKRRISLQPGHSSQKIVEPPGPCNCVSFGGSRVGGMSLSASDLHVKLEFIDGSPLQDPRESLSKITAQLVLVEVSTMVIGETLTACRIQITNMDTEPHNLSSYVEFEYAYSELGELKRSSGTTFGDPFRTSEGIVNPGKTVSWGSYGHAGILPDLPKHLASITVKRVVLQLDDPGTESIHPSIRTKILTSSGCDYKK